MTSRLRLSARNAVRCAIALVLLVASWLAIGGTEPPRAARAADRFPHARHEGLFPSCAACHTTKNGEDGMYLVTQPDCANCHNGEGLARVTWSPPADRPTNLVFSHQFHVDEAGAACADCHGVPGSANRMEVVRPEPERCFTCHDVSSHFAEESPCATCHLPLARATALTLDQVAGLPMPDSHLADDFMQKHGTMAAENIQRCATCHARETCEVCHLNASLVAEIQELDRDPRVAELTATKTGNWPRPASHDDPDWMRSHGPAAGAGIGECATCHLQEGCRNCHNPVMPAVVFELPAQKAEAPERGVALADAYPPGHGPGFLLEHASEAATDNPRCATCHTEDTCAGCHAAGLVNFNTDPVRASTGAMAGANTRTAVKSRGFHEANFLARHASEAYARDLDCASCHSQEVFCRSCHENTGVSTNDPVTSSFHDSQPFWLLGHGEAARQGMESCQSCHQQRDCLQCHSAKTGWRVSPHGPDFDANRMGDRSLLMCSHCHFSDPRPGK